MSNTTLICDEEIEQVIPGVNPHSVANFNPAEYEVQDYLDNQRPRYYGEPPLAYEARVEGWKREIARYFPTSFAVTTGNTQQLPEHNIHKCRHCGQTNVRYIVAVKHIPTGVNMVFGDVCVAHLGFHNHNAFRAAQLRARAAQGNANLLAYRKRCQFLEQQPELKAAIDRGEPELSIHASNVFAQDVYGKLNRYGVISDRQISALLASWERDHQREANRIVREREEAVRRETAQPAPNGRATVIGKIVSASQRATSFGLVWKMLVQLDSGAKVWCSVPTALTVRARELRDKRIKFSAKFTPKTDDPTFAFGSRPTQAEVLV